MRLVDSDSAETIKKIPPAQLPMLLRLLGSSAFLGDVLRCGTVLYCGIFFRPRLSGDCQSRRFALHNAIRVRLEIDFTRQRSATKSSPIMIRTERGTVIAHCSTAAVASGGNMKSFHVFRHPTNGLEAVKVGVAWPAFFLRAHMVAVASTMAGRWSLDCRLCPAGQCQRNC